MTQKDLSKSFEGTYGTMYYVQDMAKTVQFYKETLNLTPKMESPEWTEYDFNGHSLCLHLADVTSKLNGKSILITKVKSLKEVVGELKTRGVEFVQDVKEVAPGCFAADFIDPSGNVVSLYEHLG